VIGDPSIHDIFARLDLRAPQAATVSADEVALFTPGLLDASERGGWLTPATPARSVDCPACYGDHASEVVWIGGTEERAYIDCPTVRRVPVDHHQLDRWRIDERGVVSWLAIELGVRATPATVTEGLWRVGGGQVGGQRRVMFLAIGGVSAKAIDEATKRVRLPVVFSCGAVAEPASAAMLPLAEFVHLRDGRLAFDWRLLEDACADLRPIQDATASAGASTRPGRRSGRTMGSMLDCWFTCHNLGDRFDSTHDAYVAIARYLTSRPPQGMDALPIARYANARSRAKTQRMRRGGCTWWRCADGPPSDLLSA
jgi:hypothetical protein